MSRFGPITLINGLPHALRRIRGTLVRVNVLSVRFAREQTAASRVMVNGGLSTPRAPAQAELHLFSQYLGPRRPLRAMARVQNVSGAGGHVRAHKLQLVIEGPIGQQGAVEWVSRTGLLNLKLTKGRGVKDARPSSQFTIGKSGMAIIEAPHALFRGIFHGGERKGDQPVFKAGRGSALITMGGTAVEVNFEKPLGSTFFGGYVAQEKPPSSPIRAARFGSRFK